MITLRLYSYDTELRCLYKAVNHYGCLCREIDTYWLWERAFIAYQLKSIIKRNSY